MQEKKQGERMEVRIVSPSANIVDEPGTEELIKRAEEVLKRNAINFSYSASCKGKSAFLSGSKEKRAKDLMDAFLDKNVNAILSSQGGDNSNDLLELLDYGEIAKNRKPFFGLSDITVLLNVIALKSGIITYHGLDFLWGLGKNATPYTEGLLTAFLKEKQLETKKNPNTAKWGSIANGQGEGVFLGGCLASFCLLLGTEFDPLVMLNSDYLLILEDIGESKSLIKSKLTQIRQHKQISLCKGIIIGNFAFCEQKPKENDLAVEDLAKEVFDDLNIPIVKIPEIGHCVENIIIPIGARGRIEGNDQNVSLKFL